MKRQTFKFKAVLPLTACVVALGTLASAATEMDRDARFEQLDQNGDGKIERAELDAQRDARFAASDTNGDGFCPWTKSGRKPSNGLTTVLHR